MIITLNKKIILIILSILILLVIFILNDNETLNVSNYNKKYIAFTYDDGPSKYTNEILKILEETNSSATFFVIGNKIDKYKDTILNIYNSNSEVGSHTFSHKDLTLLNDKDINDELNKTNKEYYKITNDNIKYLRPPYEKYNKNITNYNYTIITWNIDTLDWKYKDKYKIYNNIIKNACDGCIVLMHDLYNETKEATLMAIKTLNKMNYEVISISNLIKIKGYNINENKIISNIK